MIVVHSLREFVVACKFHICIGMSVRRYTYFYAQDLRELLMQENMERDGFCVVQGCVQGGADECVRQHVLRVLGMKGLVVDPAKHFKEMLTKSIRWDQSPPTWEGPAFGGVKYRGWMQASGTGRMFDDWCPPPIRTAQEAVKPVVALLRGCLAKDLELVPERSSIKVDGCPEFGPHLDMNRQGDIQAVIALTETSFVVWPGTHKLQIGPADGTGYYKLTSDDLFMVEGQGCKRLDIKAAVGDALFMTGGRLVHGSPAGEAEERICTYASFTMRTVDEARAAPRKTRKISKVPG